VNGVDVKVLAKRVQYYDADGKLVTESFQDYTRKTMLKDSDYASLDSFVRKWQEAPANRSSLKSWSNSVSVGCAGRRGGKDLDPFDLLCHVVYGQPPLTRMSVPPTCESVTISPNMPNPRSRC
jgi:type I restriction enzyme R subunit